MNPYVSHLIGQIRMTELQEQAARHRQVARVRSEQSGRWRTAAGEWLISMGERLIPTPTARPLGLPR